MGMHNFLVPEAQVRRMRDPWEKCVRNSKFSILPG